MFNLNEQLEQNVMCGLAEDAGEVTEEALAPARQLILGLGREVLDAVRRYVKLLRDLESESQAIRCGAETKIQKLEDREQV